MHFGSLGSSNHLDTMTDLLSRVPNYERATQGFLGGGVTPLEASADLPSYSELEGVSRVRSDGALLTRREADAASLYDLRDDNRTPAPRRPVRMESTDTATLHGSPRGLSNLSIAALEQPRRRNATFTIAS